MDHYQVVMVHYSYGPVYKRATLYTLFKGYFRGRDWIRISSWVRGRIGLWVGVGVGVGIRQRVGLC